MEAVIRQQSPGHERGRDGNIEDFEGSEPLLYGTVPVDTCHHTFD